MAALRHIFASGGAHHLIPRPTRRARWDFCGLVTAMLLTLIAATEVRAAIPPEPREYAIKAAALYNIVSFTEWPDSAFAQPDAPLVIGVLGTGPVADLIDGLVQDESWRGHKLVVRHFARIADVRTCQVLYVAHSEQSNTPEVRKRFSHRPVLLVSDADNFAAEGGAVQLAIERNRLHILVNLAVTRSSGLRLSSNLLHLATIVGPMPEPANAPQGGMRMLPDALLRGLICAALVD
jgi:hypothetical protein